MKRLERDVEGESAQKKALHHQRSGLQRTVDEKSDEIAQLKERLGQLDKSRAARFAWEIMIDKNVELLTSFTPLIRDDSINLEQLGDQMGGTTFIRMHCKHVEEFLREAKQDGNWYCVMALCKKGHKHERCHHERRACKIGDDEYDDCLQLRLASTLGEDGKPKVEFRMAKYNWQEKRWASARGR